MTFLVALLMLAGAPRTVSGVVRDASGAAVPNAVVILRALSGPSASEQQTLSGPDGHFAIVTSADGDVTLVVRAGGFAEQTRRLISGTPAAGVEIVLEPAPLLETVTVTASRSEQRVIDLPASVNVLTSEEIKESAAVVADDVLRQISTFSLFRRTSSLSSHPSAQGVSLRGIGPSGVSRTLVLSDGVPFNDPFGGWVYWTRIPLDSVDRIEVVESSSASLYGNYAMGGVINIISGRPSRRTIELTPQYGNRRSPKVDVFASDVWGKVGVTVDGSVFNTDGFPIVAAGERGPIDNNATVKFHNVNVKLDYRPSDRVSAFVRGGFFGEDRGNGKVLEVNDTQSTSASGGVRIQLRDGSELQGTLFGDFEHFHSTFLAVTAPSATVAARSIVRLTIDQHVPTHSAGASAQWSKAFGLKNAFSAGTDFHWVDGESQEDSFNAAPGPVVPPVQQAVLALQRASGGTQRSEGLFVQDVVAVAPKLTVTLSARLDRWRNYNAHNLETNVPSGTPTANNRLLPDRDDTVASPRLAAVYHLADRFNVWGSIGSGFRAPTLNELYRQFRVGTVLTLPNDQLGPERLVGGEVGVNVVPAKNVTVRTTWFDNRMTNPVSNVTTSTSGANVTQQRQNLGKTDIWGVQSDVEYRYGPSWRVAAAYLFNHATVEEFAANPALVGLFIPQVPKHRGSLQVAYSNPRFVTVSLGLQFVGRQFDDDQNVRVVPGETAPGLPGYALADVTLSRRLSRNLDLFIGVQNLFNQEYIVGTLPTTIGSPRLVNGGVRIRLQGR